MANEGWGNADDAGGEVVASSEDEQGGWATEGKDYLKSMDETLERFIHVIK